MARKFQSISLFMVMPHIDFDFQLTNILWTEKYQAEPLDFGQAKRMGME